MSQVQEKLTTGGRGPDELLVLLKEAQQKSGYLSRETIIGLAEALGLPPSEVYGVASFYSFLATKPLGRNVIRVCRSLPCYLENSVGIIEAVNQAIGLRPGETTADGRFSLELTNCIGLCDQAPAMMINDDVHGNLTPEKITRILETYQ